MHGLITSWLIDTNSINLNSGTSQLLALISTIPFCNMLLDEGSPVFTLLLCLLSNTRHGRVYSSIPEQTLSA
jgi:hypothetical protein